MSFLGRIIVIVFGLIVAIMAAGVTLAIGIIAPDWAGVDADPFERLSFFIVSFFATSFVGAVAILPAAVLIVVSEAARWRSFLYYGVGGALVALASYYGSDISVRLENTTDVTPVTNVLQLAAAAGIIGGLVYWLIAGRNAGRWLELKAISWTAQFNAASSRSLPQRARQIRSRSRHILRPLAGYRLNGEVSQPWALKIGPSINGRQRTATPAVFANDAMRIAAG